MSPGYKILVDWACVSYCVRVWTSWAVRPNEPSGFLDQYTPTVNQTPLRHLLRALRKYYQFAPTRTRNTEEILSSFCCDIERRPRSLKLIGENAKRTGGFSCESGDAQQRLLIILHFQRSLSNGPLVEREREKKKS